VQGKWPSLRRFVLVASLVGVTSPPLIDETQDYSRVTGDPEMSGRVNPIALLCVAFSRLPDAEDLRARGLP
jgi:hypothetical protein